MVELFRLRDDDVETQSLSEDESEDESLDGILQNFYENEHFNKIMNLLDIQMSCMAILQESINKIRNHMINKYT